MKVSILTFREIKNLTHSPKKNLVFTFLRYKSFENTAEKGEIALFSTLLKNSTPFSSNLKTSPAISSVRKSLKFVIWKRVKIPTEECLKKKIESDLLKIQFQL